MFGAAIPVCGAGNTELTPHVVDVAVWAFHGALDRNVPVAGSRDMIDAIKKAGGNPRYTEFEDKAHNIWYAVTQTTGIWDWLFEQKKWTDSAHW
jgi:predicted peptidase